MGRRRDESTLSYFTTKAALAATEAKREDPGKEGACPSWKNGNLSEALGVVSCQVVKPGDGDTGLLPGRRGWAALFRGAGQGLQGGRGNAETGAGGGRALGNAGGSSQVALCQPRTGGGGTWALARSAGVLRGQKPRV